MLGAVTWVALIARYSVPSLWVDCALRGGAIAVMVFDDCDRGGVSRLDDGARLDDKTRYN
jgi:hypothetical protein